MIYLIALVSIILGAAGQFCLKVGVTAHKSLGDAASAWELLTDVWFLSGLTVYGLSLLTWLYVLSRLELSRAYPMVSIGYILTTAMACIWLGETLTWQKVLGISLIIIGVFFISRP